MSKIRLAMIGCGGNSGGHARRMNSFEEVEVVAGVDVNTEIVEKYIDRNLPELDPRPSVYDDLDQMLAEVKPNAVVISTPHTLHFEQGMKALDADCHVLMEKPMVTSADHAYAITEKVKETGKVFTIGYNTPCTANFYYLREVIRSEKLGKLDLISGYLSQEWRRATRGAWRQVPELSGGGQAYDSGAHILNSLCWTAEDDIAEVHAFVDNMDTPVDINSSINVRFKNGVFASIVIGGNCPSGSSHMTYLFENGRIDIDGWGGGWINVWDGSTKIEPEITDEMNARSPDHNFIDAILGRAEPRTSPINGIIQSELMDAIYKSAETGQVVRPKKR